MRSCAYVIIFDLQIQCPSSFKQEISGALRSCIILDISSLHSVVGYRRLGTTALCRNAGDQLPSDASNNLEYGRPQLHRRQCLNTRISCTVRVTSPTQETPELNLRV